MSANQSGVINDENDKSTSDKIIAENEVKPRMLQCRMPRIECDRLGHRADKCTVKKDVNAVKERATRSNLYEQPVLINEYKTHGLIDTGSNCTLLQASVIERYNMVISVTLDNVLRGFTRQITTSITVHTSGTVTKWSADYPRAARAGT